MAKNLGDVEAPSCLVRKHVRSGDLNVERFFSLRDQLSDALDRVYVKMNCVDPIVQVRGEIYKYIACFVDSDEDYLCRLIFPVGKHLHMVRDETLDVIVKPVEVVNNNHACL